MKPENMFNREIHYFICTSDGYRNDRLAVNDPEHETHILRYIKNEALELNADISNKNDFHLQRYEHGKPVEKFNYKLIFWKQERIF
ncbi:MAG: hypothetical protein IT279_11200 [Ignavibacteriaceae bacterium]|nr:hypothetical protein [Ignavibacteriaceae bacterium]